MFRDGLMNFIIFCFTLFESESHSVLSDSLQLHGLSMEFSRPEYWSRQPSPSPGDLPNPGIEPRSPASQEDSLPAEPPIPLIYSQIRKGALMHDFYVFEECQLTVLQAYIFNFYSKLISRQETTSASQGTSVADVSLTLGGKALDLGGLGRQGPGLRRTGDYCLFVDLFWDCEHKINQHQLC